MEIKDIMKPAEVIEGRSPLSEAARKIVKKNIGSLIVMDKGVMKGIVTKEDLLKHFGKDISVDEIMTKKIISLTVEDGVDKAREILKNNRINVIPIIEGDKLAGIVTGREIIKNYCEPGDEFLLS